MVRTRSGTIECERRSFLPLAGEASLLIAWSGTSRPRRSWLRRIKYVSLKAPTPGQSSGWRGVFVQDRSAATETVGRETCCPA